MRCIFLLAFLCCSAFAQMVWFEPNRGQVSGQTEWIGRAKGAYLYITANEVVYANKKNVHMRLVGASTKARVEGMDPTGGYSSYFTGRDEKTWFTGIPHFSRLRYRDVYPGIDIVYYGSGRNVEYDFVVKPGADPDRIELAFSEPVKIDGGDMLVAGLRQHRPRVMQNGRTIASEYRITDQQHVQFALGEYDRAKDLTVDPVLEFASYLGGPGEDLLLQLAVDDTGFLYLAGSTQSPASPGLNPFQQSNLAFRAPYLFKLDPSGKHILYYVILGSDSYSNASAMAIGKDGSMVMVGATSSDNFPLKNAFQSEYKAAFNNAFLTKLSSDGRTLIYSTYYGGSYTERPASLRLDQQGEAYITGETSSHDLPLKGAIQKAYGGGDVDCFVARVSSQGSLVFSTYLGGSGLDICGDLAIATDGIVIAGGSASIDFPLRNASQTETNPRTGYATPALVKLALDGSQIIFSTFIGGPTGGVAWAVTLDNVGNICTAGAVSDNKLITKKAFQSQPASNTFGSRVGDLIGFLAKYDSTAHSLVYATYFGGIGPTSIGKLVVDGQGSSYVTGYTQSADFPVNNSLQGFLGTQNCFVAKFVPSGDALVYSTLFGGTRNGGCNTLAVDASGNAYFGGSTTSPDLPVKNAFQQNYGGGYDGFFGKISDNTTLPPSPITASSMRLSFQFVQGGPNPVPSNISVTGSAFSASASALWIAVTATSTSVSVGIRPAALGPGVYNASVTLSPPAGAPAVIDVALTVLAPAPVLSSVDPSFIPLNSDDVAVIVHGSGFTTGTTLQLNTQPWSASPVVVINSNTIRLTFTKPILIFQTTWTITAQNPQSALSNVLTIAVGEPAPYFTAGSVTNAASFAAGPVAPGEIVTIFGTNLNQMITFDNIAAELIYSSATQVSVTVPYAVSGPTTTLRVGTVPVALDVNASAPGIFAAVSDRANNIVTLYATGCGLLSQETLPRCTLPVSVAINGQDAPVLYAGVAPGLPQGANQINVQIPTGISSGPVTIVFRAGDVASKAFNFDLP
jgi:uncharacterized protein (TIGR03437 family)